MESFDWGRYLISLFAVGGLIVGLAYIVKRAGLATKFKQSQSLHGNMAIIDTLYLDARRKLVIVKCKEQEHLLLLAQDHSEHIAKLEK